ILQWQRMAAHPEANPVAVVNPPVQPEKPAVEQPPPQPDRKETLKKAAARHLADKSPNPAGVEDCIDLGVLYLEQHSIREARELFAHMHERRPPSAYHFVGLLGLAVTDALESKNRESRSKFTSLFDSKSRDNRIQILNDYLTKKPEFAKWVNEA